MSHSDWRDPNAPSCVKARLELFKNLRVCPGWPLRKQLQAALAAVVKWDLERRDEPMLKACIQREFCKALSKTGREPAFWQPILTWLVPSDDASRRGLARQARRERRA